MKNRWFIPLEMACAIAFSIPLMVPLAAPLSWLALIPVFLTEMKIGDASYRHPFLSAYGRGFLFFFAAGLTTFWWFLEMYPLDYVGLSESGSVAVVAAGWFGLSLLQSVFRAFVFVFMQLLFRKTGLHRAPALVPPSAAALWCLFEWLQTQTWLGVPWGKVAVGQAGYAAFIQSAALLGPYFISFLVISVNGWLALSLRSLRLHKSRLSVCYASVALALFAANLTFGLVRIHVRETDVSSETVQIAAIQANISSKEKWGSDSQKSMLETFISLSKEAAADGARVILWSETALPYEIDDRPWMMSALRSLAEETGADLYVGAFYRDENDRLYNAMFLFRPDGTVGSDLYFKRRLVPFGEFVPWRPLFEAIYPPLSQTSALSEDLYPGDDATVFHTDSGDFGVLLCFDSIYEELTRASINGGAEAILLSTNDSWFGDSAAVWEHNRHAVLRAVESGRCVVRSANTGVSSVITDTGKIIEVLEPLREGYIISNIELHTEETLFVRAGSWILYAMALFLCAEVCVLQFRNRRERKPNRT